MTDKKIEKIVEAERRLRVPKFRKKPVVIEAELWNGPATAPRILEFTDFTAAIELFEGRQVVTISTLGGATRAELGDWIIKGVKGEFYPVKGDIFRETYEDAEDAKSWPVLDSLGKECQR